MIINEILKEIEDARGEDMQTFLAAHTVLLAVHSKVLACHAECMGMNAENMSAACRNQNPPYADDLYLKCMRKWELINEKGEPII